MSDILVCQAGTCRRNGGEAVLIEIEALVPDDINCKVQPSGCLGLCSRAPNAIVLKGEQEQEFTRIDSIEKSVEVIKAATGKTPVTTNPEVQARLSGVRAIRAREEALSVYRWNSALKATQSQIDGYSSSSGSSSSSSSNKGNKQRGLNQAKTMFRTISMKAGFDDLVNNPSGDAPLQMPAKIENYSPWMLQNITVVTRHTAVLHFTSSDLKRGTPHPRGRGRAPPTPITWHTTMLAEVGSNTEGPLPWIERDYTPISSAKEWESGRCDLLIKIYNDGSATSWLHGVMNQSSSQPVVVWLSQPIQTLKVPSLTPTASSAFVPASVLLILGGTGVVALSQTLHHRDPQRNLGISTPRKSQLHAPIDLLLSCREDDVLMLPEVIKFCKEAQDIRCDNMSGASSTSGGVSSEERENKGLRNCVLLLTEALKEIDVEKTYPFAEPLPQHRRDMINELRKLSNAQVLDSRLTIEVVTQSLSRMPQPCRVVVSGPSGFNAAARGMLIAANLSDDCITILEA